MLPNSTDPKPLFTLSIADIALTKHLMSEVLNENLNKDKEPTPSAKTGEDEMDIPGLAKFLHCSKVSIHKYKKKGMPYYRVGRKILFLKSEVLNFMKTIKSKNMRKAARIVTKSYPFCYAIARTNGYSDNNYSFRS